jgi:hypothetical protein
VRLLKAEADAHSSNLGGEDCVARDAVLEALFLTRKHNLMDEQPFLGDLAERTASTLDDHLHVREGIKGNILWFIRGTRHTQQRVCGVSGVLFALFVVPIHSQFPNATVLVSNPAKLIKKGGCVDFE